MKRILFPLVLALLIITACLEPDRNAPYDPNNPNKPSLYGYTYDYNWSVLPGATLQLKLGGVIKYDTVSNDEGWFEFRYIDPGIYELYGESEYYSPFVETLYLCAGCRDTIDVHFDELYFDFDDEPIGTQQPTRFLRLFGDWQVQEDPGEPDRHSTPNVYNAVHNGGIDPFAIAALRDTLEDFWVSVNIKVLSSSSSWHAGLVLRYQNENNYYFVHFMPDALSLMKMRNGSLTELANTHSYTFAADTWYHISAHLSDNKIMIFIDYEKAFEIYDTPSPLYAGLAGLWLYTSEPTGSATANFDDVHLWP
jgi:hypothetical protein